MSRSPRERSKRGCIFSKNILFMTSTFIIRHIVRSDGSCRPPLPKKRKIPLLPPPPEAGEVFKCYRNNIHRHLLFFNSDGLLNFSMFVRAPDLGIKCFPFRRFRFGCLHRQLRCPLLEPVVCCECWKYPGLMRSRRLKPEKKRVFTEWVLPDHSSDATLK